MSEPAPPSPSSSPPVPAPLAVPDARALVGKRILIIVENLPVPFDRRVWMEARTLAAAGARVSVICPTGRGYEAREAIIEGIHIHRHPLPVEAKGVLGYLIEYGAALFWQFLLTARIFSRGGIDVIHGCNPPDLIFLVAAPFRLLGVKYLFDHHDINPELYEAKFGRRGLFWRLTLVFERLSFRLASVAIATNESYRRIAIERGRMRPQDVFVVRSGPDLTRVKGVPPEPSWKAGRAFLIGYVGVMGPQEGIDLLLEAVRHLVHDKNRRDIQFALVGGGPSLEALKRRAAALGVGDYVTFTGRVPDKDVFEILSTADICVNPDRVNAMNDKSTMNKIMEYMALGKPIVQFDVTEGRVSAGAAALYAAPNDPIDFAGKIEDLLIDPARRHAMGAFGRHRIEKDLNWTQSIAPLLAAYGKLF